MEMGPKSPPTKALPNRLSDKSHPTLDEVPDDALLIVLTALPAADARAAFCVSQRWVSAASQARDVRLRLYWRGLFGSDVGFPEENVKLLNAADCMRFEARLCNAQAKSWRCLSCLRPHALRLGEFCVDCVGDSDSFVHGHGRFVACNVSCGHNSQSVYWCPLCEASACRTCLMSGACTMCLLVDVDTPVCEPCMR